MSAAASPDTVRLQLRWLHQFQFAGYYMALEKGFYKEAGLDVELLEGGPSALKPVDAMLSGKVDFAISNSGVIIERMKGKPVVALASIMQTSPIVWIVREDSGIHTPLDLAGKNLMLMPPPESAELLATLRKEGIDISKLRIQPTSFNLADLVSGKTDAYDGYLSNEPYWLERQGVGYRLINPREYGVNFYNDVLIGSERFLQKHPKKVDAFVRASLRGWEYALTHIEESVQFIQQRYAPDKSLEHLRYEARELAKLIMPELVRVGHMNPGRWRHIAETYAELGMIEPTFDLEGFLYDPNPPPQDLTWLYRWLAITFGGGVIVTAIALHIFRINRKLKASEKLNLRMLEDLRQAKEAAENALTEQRQFMDMLNHELKTPMSVLRISLEMENPGASAKHHAVQALKDMDAIVERCLQVDQLDHHQLAPQKHSCDIKAMLVELSTISAAAQRIAIELVETLPEVETDCLFLHVILSNLIDNALKYGALDSVIRIYANPHEQAGRLGVRVSIVNAPGSAGVPDPDRVFEKYYRSPRAHGKTGSGLGLYLVKRMAEILGGSISYQFHGVEVTFELWIPC